MTSPVDLVNARIAGVLEQCEAAIERGDRDQAERHYEELRFLEAMLVDLAEHSDEQVTAMLDALDEALDRGGA